MITTFNFANTEEELKQFQDAKEMKKFAWSHGCDGIELQVFKELAETYLEPALIQGIHLPFYNCWMDFWRGNEDGLKAEFGDLKTAFAVYGGCDHLAFIEQYQKELDRAQQYQAKYVVFHVSEVTIDQSFNHQFVYTDEQVIEAACQMINQLLDGRGYTFDFLMENLWWPGLNFQSVAMTKKLLAGVHYKKKGFMLDTGHLMNTNWNLRTQAEAVDYIHEVLDAHEEILPWIKGIHLNASLSGAYVQQSFREPYIPAEDYQAKRSQAFGHVFQIDQHQPFTDRGRQSIIDRIKPEYVTHELISRSREELSEFLRLQRIDKDAV